MNAALDELRSCCRTPDALSSFETFESKLLKKLGMTRQNLNRASSFALDTRDADWKSRLSRGGRPTLTTGWSLSQSPRNASTTSRISNVTAEAVMTGTSKIFYGESGLAKSKTTGNLASLIPAMTKRPTRATADSEPKSDMLEKPSDRRRTSYFECSPETRVRAMKEREDRAARRVAETRQRSCSRFPSLGIPKSETHGKIRQSSARITVRADEEQSSMPGGKVNTYDAVVESLDCAMLESGHAIPPPATSMSVPPRVQMVNVPGGGKEKVVKSRRKAERQTSGEMVKTLLGAGVREVKKMGRRVGGINWAGSNEELV